MRKTVFRALVYLIIIIILIVINMYVFRSDFPKFTIITLLGSVIGLLYFPYKTFFNIK
jgi:hypothetical protein